MERPVIVVNTMDKVFNIEFFTNFLNDSIGNMVLCIACVLMLSYLRGIPPKFESKKMIIAGAVLSVSAFISRFIAHSCIIKHEIPDGDMLMTQILVKLVLNVKLTEIPQISWLWCNVLTTIIGFASICVGAFILMETYKAKHIVPMAIVQLSAFFLKEMFKIPYKNMISKIIFLFFNKKLKIVAYGYNCFAYGCYMIIMIIAYILITKHIYEIFWTKKIHVIKHIISFVSLFIVYSVLTIFLNLIIESLDTDNAPDLFSAIFELIITPFLAIALLIVPKQTYSITRAELQNDFYEVKREEKVELYEYSQAQSTAIRKYIHDLPNHFRMIDEMAAKINADEISEYVHGLDKELVEAKCEFSTGNAYLDDLLVTELKIAKKFDANIIFTGVFPNEGIKKKDITTVFMNLIDNAIEACKKVSDKREISINSKIVDNRVYVSISNPFEHTPKKSNEIFKTTKKDNGFHGFGMSNVKNTVERKGYDGNFSTEEKNNIFTASIDMKFKL